MEVWTLSVEADAAVLMVVLYDNIPSVATLIRSTRPDHKDIYSFWCQLAVSSARLGRRQLLAQICVAFCA